MKALKLGANHPMGPLELGDFIGLDTVLAIMKGRLVGATKGHALLKKKADALNMRFRSVRLSLRRVVHHVRALPCTPASPCALVRARLRYVSRRQIERLECLRSCACMVIYTALSPPPTGGSAVRAVQTDPLGNSNSSGPVSEPSRPLIVRFTAYCAFAIEGSPA